MSQVTGDYPKVKGIKFESIEMVPNSSDLITNCIPPGAKIIKLSANANGTSDFVTLPLLASVPQGHEIQITAGVANCKVRTPASSNQEINSEDCDGTKTYALAATQIHKFIKIDDTVGWMGHGYTAIGAVTTAIVPD